MKKVWFKPKRFWNWFAAYYPVSYEGWVFSFLMLGFLVYRYWVESIRADNLQDAIIGFSPWFFGTALVFDFLTRIKGEYPSWWRRKWIRNGKAPN